VGYENTPALPSVFRGSPTTATIVHPGRRFWPTARRSVPPSVLTFRLTSAGCLLDGIASAGRRISTTLVSWKRCPARDRPPWAGVTRSVTSLPVRPPREAARYPLARHSHAARSVRIRRPTELRVEDAGHEFHPIDQPRAGAAVVGRGVHGPHRPALHGGQILPARKEGHAPGLPLHVIDDVEPAGRQHDDLGRSVDHRLRGHPCGWKTDALEHLLAARGLHLGRHPVAGRIRGLQPFADPHAPTRRPLGDAVPNHRHAVRPRPSIRLAVSTGVPLTSGG
jgi:hypothetical protein